MKIKSSSRVRIITTRVYSAAHLKRYYPDGFKRAHEKHCQFVAEDSYRMEEILGSLKRLFEVTGGAVRMADWQIGPWNQSYIRATFNQDGAGEIKGARALAWIENNLLGQFRAPWGLNKKDGNLHENGDNGKRGKHYRKIWRRWYAPGSVKSCPISGMYYDEDFIDEIVKGIRAGGGETLKEAFEGLAYKAQHMIEEEERYESEEAQFLDAADANGWEYTRDGEMV